MESVEFAYAENVACHGDFSNMLVEDFLNDDFLSDVKGYETEEKENESFEKIEERMDFCEENNRSNSSALPFEEFPMPEQDMEELEWVSSIIHENSESEFPKTEVIKPKPEPLKLELKLEPQEHAQPLTVAPIEARAKRSKRRITYKGPWITSSSSTSSSSSSSCLTTSSASSSSSYSSHLLFMRNIFDEIPAPMRSMKKKRGRKPKNMLQQSMRGVVGNMERRCTHCGSTKTPQWRAGPSGAKTLCNACGVRYKSGRLLPEYRPACSPTFSSNIHSNSHRKVLEMRRKKEVKDENKFGYVNSALPVASY